MQQYLTENNLKYEVYDMQNRISKKCNPKFIVEKEWAVLDKTEWNNLTIDNKLNVKRQLINKGLKIIIE